MHDSRVKAFSMMLCTTILPPQMFVKPFKILRDNALETLSLVTLILLSGFSLVKSNMVKIWTLVACLC